MPEQLLRGPQIARGGIHGRAERVPQVIGPESCLVQLDAGAFEGFPGGRRAKRPPTVKFVKSTQGFQAGARQGDGLASRPLALPSPLNEDVPHPTVRPWAAGA